MTSLKLLDVKKNFGEHSEYNDNQELKEIRSLLWGPDINTDIFKRWSQGFEFSPHEPSALVQNEGGPCAIIAPVQGFLLKTLLAETPGHCFQDLTPDKCNRLLVQAVCNILQKCSGPCYKIVELATSQTKLRHMNEECQSSRLHEEAADIDLIRHLSPHVFHERLKVLVLETIADVELYYTQNPTLLSEKFGVLLFLYSVISTKGVDLVKNELSDTTEPLIHETYGYGSQGLINLMLTGRAVAHVWDHEQDIGGLKLKGIDQQSDIGFITLMEQMQYCTVGSFFKNPKHPVWIMGSETHLTVLFSFEKRLVSPETPSESARRIFKQFDPEGNNFIESLLLQDLLCALDLVSDPEYVEIMQKKLDAENLGIILLNAFMDEFFAGEKKSTPDTFMLLHYNGLLRSNVDNKVIYHRGNAILLECGDLRNICQSNSMLTCLQTKWPSIEVNWQGTRTPSLN